MFSLTALAPMFSLTALAPMFLMFAQMFAPGHAWGLGEIVISVVIMAAVIGILFVACRAMGVVIPPWAIQIFWIVVIAFVAIIAIRFLLSL